MKVFQVFCFILIIFQVNSQVTLTGYCDFPKTSISIFDVEEYITETENIIAETLIDEKGRFKIIFACSEIKKVVIRHNNNYSWMYVQPNGKYFIEIPKDGQITQFQSNNEIEILFYNLDSTDINYKILGFEAWLDNYLADISVLKNYQSGEYTRKISDLKKEVNTIYLEDTSVFFRNYLRYSMAINVDDLNFIGAPSKEDKFSLYIKGKPIMTYNDRYIEYFKSFYQDYFYSLPKDLQFELMSNILSHNLENCINTIKKDVFGFNRECAELIFLLIIQKGDLKQELTVDNSILFLQNIAKNSEFPNNQKIAMNILKKLAQTITIGNKFPVLELEENKIIEIQKGKIVYIHCFDPKNQNCLIEISALLKLQEKYGKYITIISIYPKPKNGFSSLEEQKINLIKWKKYEIETTNEKIWQTLNISTFPYYFLLDKDLVLTAAPALAPTPNGSYETIEKTFYEIKMKATESGE